MVDEPDIVKMLREEEKIGVLHCSIQELISHDDKVDDNSEEVEEKTVRFAEEDTKFESTMHIKTLFLGISGENYNKILLQLKKSGYSVDIKCVSSENEFGENLHDDNWDIILADYILSRINLSKIVSIVKNTKPETPIILVADKLNEDEAISYLKKGVSNYVLKDNLKRAGVVVKQTLEIVSLKKTKESEDIYHDLFENANDLIQAVRPDGSFLYVNSSWKKTLGYTDKELSNLNVFDVMSKESIPHCKEVFKRIMSGEKVNDIETTFLTKNGKKIHLQGSISCKFKDGKPFSTRGIFRDITEHKMLEEILKMYKNSLDNATDAIGISTAQGKHFYQNKAFEQMFGNIGESPVESIYVDKKVGQEVFRTIMSGKPWTGELKMLTRNGLVRDIYLKAYPNIDNNGNITSLVGVHTDITEQKKSEEKYKTLFQSSADGILIADITTRTFTDANPAICNLLGYTKEELCRMSVQDIHPRESLKYVLSEFEAQSRGEKILAKNIPCLKKNGSILYAEVNSTGTLIDGRKCNIGFFRDITKQKENEEENESILNAAADGIIIIDKSYNIVKMNKTLAEMCGINSDKVKDKKCSDVFSSEKCKTKDCALATVLRTGKSFQTELLMITKEGKKIPCLLKAMPFKDISGNTIGIIEDFRDISFIKETEEKLRKSYGIINKSPIIAFTWKNEENWPVDYVSDNVKDLFGYSKKEFIDGKISFSKTIHPDDLKRVVSEVKKYSEDKKCNEFTQDYRIITKKGEVKWIYDRTMIRRDENENPVFFDGIILDITEEKRKENELKEKIEELERYKKVTVGREIKMIELKEKIKKLEGGKK
jgi:PAS domain S-box-containing protein